MLAWLLPISLVWVVAATYLGGFPLELSGGSGFRQVVGLLITVVLFIALWKGLHAILGPGVIAGIAVPTAVTVLGFPALAWMGFRLVGVQVRRAPASEH